MKIDLKPSAVTWVVVVLMAVSGIVFLKFVLNRYPVPGLTDLINAV